MGLPAKSTKGWITFSTLQTKKEQFINVNTGKFSRKIQYNWHRERNFLKFELYFAETAKHRYASERGNVRQRTEANHLCQAEPRLRLPLANSNLIWLRSYFKRIKVALERDWSFSAVSVFGNECWRYNDIFIWTYSNLCTNGSLEENAWNFNVASIVLYALNVLEENRSLLETFSVLFW